MKLFVQFVVFLSFSFSACPSGLYEDTCGNCWYAYCYNYSTHEVFYDIDEADCTGELIWVIPGDDNDIYFNNYCDPLLDKYSKLNYYDLYLLMDIDIPWVKDDLRDRPNERDIFFNSFKMALEMNNKNYFTVSGSFQKRKQKAIELVNNLLNLQ